MRPALRLAFLHFALAAAGLPGAAQALEFRSLAEPVILYDTPSKQGKPRFVMARATPVEVVVVANGWTKVRDAAGDMAWVERRSLSERRTVIVTAPKAEVRAAADAAAPLVFEAEKDVVLELQEAGPPGWAKVRHRDGAAGFLRVQQVWGF